MIFQRIMPPKKLKTGTVITSLFDNEKNNNVDERDGEDEEKRKKSKKDKKKDDKTYNCDICHLEDPTVPKFLSNDIRFLEEDEQIILKFKNERNMKILCKNHYRKEITFWKGNTKSRAKCCNILGDHKKATTTLLKDVTVKQAEDAKMFLGKKLIPFQKICHACVKKIDSKIEELKLLENNPLAEDSFPDTNDIGEDFAEDSQTDEDMSEENEVKEAILKNIQEKVPSFTKEQKSAIISVLPSSWTPHEISEKTGKLSLSPRNFKA